MKIECLQRENGRENREILADFLRTMIAVTKYGRTTIYDGELYYIPYTAVSYYVRETAERYDFIASEISEDVSVYKQDERNCLKLRTLDVDEDYVLQGTRSSGALLEEVEKKIQLNKKMRKMFQKYHFELTEQKTIYLPEQTFYGRGKKDTLFLVDGFLQKVDFKNLPSVENRFAENFLKTQSLLS